MKINDRMREVAGHWVWAALGQRVCCSDSTDTSFVRLWGCARWRISVCADLAWSLFDRIRVKAYNFIQNMNLRYRYSYDLHAK